MTEIIKNQDSIEKKVKSLTKGELRTLNNLIYFIFKYRIASPNQTTLAKHAELSRGHENRCISKLESLDFIIKTYRHLNSCIYDLNPIFLNPVFRSRLRHLLPNLMIGMLLTLSFASEARFKKNVTQTKVTLNPFTCNYLFTGNQPNVISHSTKKIGGALAHQLQNGWSDLFKNIINGEKVMKIEISPAILAIQSLQLTKRGQCALMAYPDFVHEWADKVMLKRGTKSDCFNYYNKLCLIKCQESNIVPNWKLAQELQVYFDIPESEPLLKINKVERPFVKSQLNSQQKFSNTLKQEGGRKYEQWHQPTETVRYGYMKHRVPYQEGESQERANFREMLRKNNALIDDDEPKPTKGIWPIIPKEETDKTFPGGFKKISIDLPQITKKEINVL